MRHPESWLVRWRRRLNFAVENSNLALRAGDLSNHKLRRLDALRAANQLRRLK